MNTIAIRPAEWDPLPDGRRQSPSARGSHLSDALRSRQAAEQFESMSRTFAPHGGFASCDTVTLRLRCLSDQPLSRLARGIVARTVMSVSWRDQILIPMFQFDLVDMSVKTICAQTASELRTVFDDWELALWFASPNVWLDQASPVTRLSDESAVVLDAARADRFIARG